MPTRITSTKQSIGSNCKKTWKSCGRACGQAPKKHRNSISTSRVPKGFSIWKWPFWGSSTKTTPRTASKMPINCTRGSLIPRMKAIYSRSRRKISTCLLATSPSSSKTYGKHYAITRNSTCPTRKCNSQTTAAKNSTSTCKRNGSYNCRREAKKWETMDNFYRKWWTSSRHRLFATAREWLRSGRPICCSISGRRSIQLYFSCWRGKASR